MGIYNDNHDRTCEVTWTLVACTNLCMTVEAQVQKDSSPCAVLFAKFIGYIDCSILQRPQINSQIALGGCLSAPLP